MELNDLNKVEAPVVVQHGMLGRVGLRVLVLCNRAGRFTIGGRVGLRVTGRRVGLSSECWPADAEAYCCCAV